MSVLQQIGDAKGAINQNRNVTGSRAQAYERQVVGNVLRRAGGETTMQTQIVEFVKDVGSVPVDVVTIFTKYATTPGLVYSIYNEGKKTKAQITQRIETDPQFKQDVQNVVEKIKTTGKDVLDTFVNPIVSTSKLITWAPYIVVGSLFAFLAYAFLNPGSITTPRKVSLY